MKMLKIAVMLSAVVMMGCGDDDDDRLTNPADSPYAPNIDPVDFTNGAVVDNEYFPLTPGTVMTYEGKGERIVVEVLSETREVMEIDCAIVRDRVWEGDELVEDTFDWYAQDDDGNVWYMGEESKDIEDGEVVSTDGSWEAGVDGAYPGIIMLARPLDGLWYRTEFYRGEAEDLAQVLRIDEEVSVVYGTFGPCVKILDFNALEPGVEEHKYYAPGIGLVKEVEVGDGSGAIELIDIQTE
jgi:hypothetical protein